MLIKTSRGRLLLLGALLFIAIIFATSWGPGQGFQTPDYAKQWTNDAYSSWTGTGQDEDKDDGFDTANPVADPGTLLTDDVPDKSTQKSKDQPPVLEIPQQSSDKPSPATQAASLGAAPSSAAPPTKSLQQQAESLANPTVKVAETLNPMSMPMSINEAPDSVTNMSIYHVIHSQSTKSGMYFPLDFHGIASANPNFIPHYEKNDTWFMIAQRYKYITDSAFWFTELVCEAQLINDIMTCVDLPLIAPIPATESGELKCTGGLGIAVLNAGPHDARVFVGPDRPYIMWGSNSKRNCFGLWAQDFRMMLSWNSAPWPDQGWRFPVDLQRPEPYQEVEKNWFFFWSDDGTMYLHHDIWPHRVFARVEADGSIGPDLGPVTREHDDQCMARYAPDANKELESIHQGTNSLLITMCKRADPTCQPTPDNTFIMHILQHKTYYFWHAVYEPYVVFYKQQSPFGMHAISSKPIWINGRRKAGHPQVDPDTIPPLQPELLYIVSANWRDNDRMYHGYLDDVIMIGFGLEDKYSGGIDVLAEDLIGEMNYC